MDLYDINVVDLVDTKRPIRDVPDFAASNKMRPRGWGGGGLKSFLLMPVNNVQIWFSFSS